MSCGFFPGSSRNKSQILTLYCSTETCLDPEPWVTSAAHKALSGLDCFIHFKGMYVQVGSLPIEINGKVIAGR